LAECKAEKMIKVHRSQYMGMLWCLGLCVSINTNAETNLTPQTLYKTLSKDVTPELSSSGNFKVGVKTLQVTNEVYVDPVTQEKGTRKLTLEVWYPTSDKQQKPSSYENETRSGIPFSIRANASRDAGLANTAGQFPLVVLSHGYTGYRTIMYYLGEHLASHGYIVASIDHTDSTNADVDMINTPFSGFVSTLVNRSRDQNLVLDKLINLPFLKGVIAPDKAGLIGYSMGGFGAVNTIGGCFNFSKEMAGRFTGQTDEQKMAYMQGVLNTCAGGKAPEAEVDSRWKAAMAFAPWGGQYQLFDAKALAQISVPVMYVAGEFDDVSGYQGVHWLYDQTGKENVFMLTYHQARHNIAPHPAPVEAWNTELDLGHYYEPVWDNQALNTNNNHFALAMMDCYVKAEAKACEYLTPRGESDQQSVDGSVVEPWIGFDTRFALGMKMEGK
jgi:predicted dienelactone hydrolase